MRKLVSRTVKESAADFWYEIRVARPNITWTEIQDVLRARFANYVDAQIALQKFSKTKNKTINKHFIHLHRKLHKRHGRLIARQIMLPPS